MSNYSTFFPTGGGGGSSTTGVLGNRRIFYGPGTCTWTVPSGTTSVQVHVWGGGGAATGSPTAQQGGGGGGGYARAEYAVTDSDSLAITIGGVSGTSSVTIPTQSPGSPISATGGSSSTSSSGGGGGSGSVSLASPHPTDYCFTASGGSGGNNSPCFVQCNNRPCDPNHCFRWTGTGGGGAAGSPRGPGGNGRQGCASVGDFSTGGGGGIGGPATCGSMGAGSRGCNSSGKSGCNSNCSGNCLAFERASRMDCRDDLWWRVEEIGGAGGLGWGSLTCQEQNFFVMSGGSGSGGGGGGITFKGVPFTPYGVFMGSMGAPGGFLGGGGGNIYYCQQVPTNSNTCASYVYEACPTDGKGGYAGGAGGGAEGMPGVVIIYW